MALLETNWSPPLRQLRQFAAIWFPAFWVVVAFWLWRYEWSWTVIGTTIAAGFAIGAIAYAIPMFGRFLWVTWMVGALPIGFVISQVAVAVVYYLVLSPIGLIMKLVGYDPMSRKLDRQATSYWEERDPHPESSRYFRQF